MLKLLQTSDVHLDSRLTWLGEKSNSHRQRVWQTFANVAQQAIKHQVQLVLIPGDLFDNCFVDEMSVIKVKNTLTELASAQIHTVILPGNHDRNEPKTVWDEFALEVGTSADFVHVLKENIPATGIAHLHLANLSVHIVARPVVQMKSVQSPLLQVDKYIQDNLSSAQRGEDLVVVMAHGGVRLTGKETDNFLIQPEEIARLADLGVNYLALGDWHSSLDVSQKKLSAWYSGSPEVLRKDQLQSGNVLLVNVEKSQTTVEKLKVSALEISELELNIQQYRLEQIFNEIKNKANRNLILIVNITGSSNVAVDLSKLEECEAELSEEFYFLRINNKVNLIVNQADLDLYPQGSIPHELIKLVGNEVDSKQLDQDIAQEILQLAMQTITKRK